MKYCIIKDKDGNKTLCRYNLGICSWDKESKKWKRDKIKKARLLAKEKWGRKYYSRVKYYFDKAEREPDGDAMYAVDAFLKDNNLGYMAFYLLAAIP